MGDCLEFYINGTWVAPFGNERRDIVNPATGQVRGRLAMGNETDLDAAVAAARRAFQAYAATGVQERMRLLERIAEAYEARKAEMVQAVVADLGCPVWLAEQAQVPLPATHIRVAIDVMKTYPFEVRHGSTLVRRQPVGVCGLITPWNWPVSLMITKLIPALAVGCTVVLKPSEFAPCAAVVLARVLHDAGVPPGVFNMVFGEGSVVGAALSRHPDVDAVSITGSTRAGIEVARNAADTVKRVHQELGGKSPNVLLDDADFGKAVSAGVRYMFINSGQTCSAPSRMLVPHSRQEEAVAIAKATAEALQVGPPDSGAFLGPVINQAQWNRVQELIRSGIEEGARLVVGGLGKPERLAQGYYVRPTIFADVRNDMRIAREEIFGPVLAILPYEDEEDAIRIANDTPYGLAAYVHSASIERARAVGARIHAGQINLNGDLDLLDPYSPFGGCKMSGNGREWGAYGFDAFVEEVSFVGYHPEDAA